MIHHTVSVPILSELTGKTTHPFHRAESSLTHDVRAERGGTRFNHSCSNKVNRAYHKLLSPMDSGPIRNGVLKALQGHGGPPDRDDKSAP